MVVHGTGVARPFDKYELQDLRTFAESSGTPLKQVMAGQRGSRELDELAAALEANSDSGMTMAGRDPDQPGTAYMSFTHRPTAAVTARLRALPLDTTVTSGLPLPHAELVRYSESLAGVFDGVPGAQFLSCGPTALGDAIDVRYYTTGRAPARRTLNGAALKATAHWSTDGRLKVPVHFAVGSPSERVSNRDVVDSGSELRAPKPR